MKIGFNMLLWTPFVEAEHFPLFEKIKETGYDGVEIPIFGGDVTHYWEVGKAIKDQGMDCTVVSIIPDEEHNPILWYEDTEKRQVRQLKVDLAVLSTATTPATGSEELARILGVERSESGFIRADGRSPVDTTVPGIFACGFSLGPKDIPESVTEASAAAARVAETLGRDDEGI